MIIRKQDTAIFSGILPFELKKLLELAFVPVAVRPPYFHKKMEFDDIPATHSSTKY